MSSFGPETSASSRKKSSVKSRVKKTLFGTTNASIAEDGVGASGGQAVGNKVEDSRLAGFHLTDQGKLRGTTADKLRMIEREDFDPVAFTDACFTPLNALGIEQLQGDLSTLHQECNTSILTAVEECHPAFVKVCEGVVELEGSFRQLRNLVRDHAAMVADLSAVAGEAQPTDAGHDRAASIGTDPTTSGQGERDSRVEGLARSEASLSWASLMQELDVVIAERSMTEARQLLAKGKEVVALIQGSLPPEEQHNPEFVQWINGCHADLEKQVGAMVPILESQLWDPQATYHETKVAVRLLAHVVGKTSAAQKLLAAHSATLASRVGAIMRPSAAAGQELSDGTDYAASLSQLVFSTIGKAFVDLDSIFKDCNGEVLSTFMSWAVAETRKAAGLLKRYAMSPLAAPAGLQAAISCAALALVFCRTLEGLHGICLAPHLLEELLRIVETTLTSHFEKLTDAMHAAVGQDFDAILASERGPPPPLTPPGADAPEPVLLPSVLQLEEQAHSVCFALQVLACPQVRAMARRHCMRLLERYAARLEAVYNKRRAANPRVETLLDSWVEVVMESAALLGESMLPSALAALTQTDPELGPAEEEELQQMPGCEDTLYGLARALGLAIEG